MSGSSENKGRMCPDRDSMAALDALLRFRESRSQDPNQEDHHKHGKVDSTPAASTTAPSSVGGASPVGAWAGLATKLNAFLPLNAASILFHSQQQHAANQAHARLAAMQAAATKNWGNTILAAQSAEPPSEILPHGNVAAAPLASSQQTSRTSSPSPSLLPRSQPSPTERKDSLGRTKEEVRKEKVDEALRSKPQRGRKRDNLSEKERLELTRTRNREHAKSTRIRKKARYQELLDREELCLKMQEEENAHSDRRKCLQDFFTVRQTMLAERGQSQSHGETISGSPSQDRIDSVANRLYDLVDSSVPFQFESSLPGCVDTGLEDAVSRMRECDDAMVQRVTQTFSDVNLETLKYDVESGTAGIALNKNGDAFCRVKLVLEAPAATNDGGQNEKSKTVLLSGICSAEFSSESNRLTSLKWTILEDRCTGYHQRSASVHSDTTSSERSSDTLVRQSVHPSVVSLDHARHNEADDNQQGPGMNI